MKKNDLIEILITDNGSNGEGIGRIDTGTMKGMAVFVNNTVAGDQIIVRLIKVKKTYAYGRLEKIVVPSPHRVEPECEIADKCGGCQLQHMSYEHQMEFKQKKVVDCLVRIGGVDLEGKIEPIIGMDSPYYYRNKAQFPVGRDKDGRIAIGFYASRTHSIINTEACHIQHPINTPIIKCVREFLEEYSASISIYDEQSGKGLVRHILTRVGFSTGEVMVCLVVNGEVLPYSDILVERLKAAIGEPEYALKCVALNINKENTNVILGTKIVPIYGREYICDYIGSIKYRISPLSFYQVNPVQTRKLYDKVLEFAGLTGSETVWDIYCGIGTISLFLARSARHVYGVEIVPQAIEDAKKNAAENNIENADFFVGAAEEVLPQKYVENPKMTADVVVVDPPRKGCDARLLDTIIALRPEKVVYVSCDPATLARDVKVLGEGGYDVERVQAVEQFGLTCHVESIVLLSKLNTKQNIEVELEMSELDLTAAESKATYEEIKDYVLKQSGLKVSNLYIAQIKQKCGIIERTNYNQPKTENSRQPKCPLEKEEAIRKALEHFKMIS